MTSAELVDAVHNVAFLAFWALLFIGAGSTVARVAYYRAHGFRRPRLLTRDAALVIGFALSFGLILLARALDLQGLRDNVLWAIATDAPAITAVAVYVYYELFVIERGDRRPNKADKVTDKERDYPIDDRLKDPDL